MKPINSKLILIKHHLFMVILLLTVSGNDVLAQKIKFKLEHIGDDYVGTMNPKWYDKIQITPLESDNIQLEGAKGIMEGERFGTMEFIIEKNKTGTTEKWMLKTNNGWYPVANLDFTKEKLKLSFDWGFQPDPRPIDLTVLKRAEELISDIDSWNEQDDRICDDDFNNNKWSLYCVLKQAYTDETGDFNHRAPALNIVRQNISVLNPKRDYKHQLMEFNNEQSFLDIKKLLSLCINKMEGQLNKGL